MKKSALPILLLVLGTLGSLAQSNPAGFPVSPEPPKKGSIEGTVQRDPGEQPLKKVIVEVIPEEQGDSSYTATSDSQGEFKISDVQPGRYRIFAERTGFVEVDSAGHRLAGTALSIQAGQSTTLKLRMLTAAVISGRVVDEDGDPMSNVEISVLHYGYSAGRRELEQERSERTNDIGQFRIAGLLSGRYFLSASPAPDFSTVMPSKEPANPAKADTGYVRTYYPGVTDLSQAVPLELRAGDEVPVDFTLVPTRTFRVRGSVANLASSSSTDNFGRGVVMLHPKDFSNDIASAAEVDRDGTFEIRGVASGSYSITLMRGDGETAQVGGQEVVVANSDVNHVRLMAMQSSQIRGQLRIENVSRADLTSLAVLLRPVNGSSQTSVRPEQGAVRPDGTFELKNISPGKYTVTVSGGTPNMRDFFLKKVTAGSHDITDSGLVVPGGTTFSISLIISPAAASLEGTVLNEKSEPRGNVTVVAVPDASHQDQLDRYQRSVSDQHGHFLLRGLTPGRYTIFAWEHVEEGAYYDPEFLREFERAGEPVHLAEGSHQTITLKALVAPN